MYLFVTSMTYDVVKQTLQNVVTTQTASTCVAGKSDFSTVTVSPITFSNVYGVGQDLLAIFYASASSDSFGIFTAAIDPTNFSATSTAVVNGLDTTTSTNTASTYVKKAATAVGNGIVVAGDSDLGQGDMQLIDTNAVATRLGSFGLSSASGMMVESLAMYKDSLYVLALDHSVSGAGVLELYALPSVAASSLVTTDANLDALSDDGGTASVSDWRGMADITLNARKGDTVTWTATPDDWHSFAGWYDAEGNKLSDSASYEAVVTSDQALIARFSTLASTRLWGASALDTMARIVDEGSWSRGDVVVLATSEGYWDALTASGIAGLADAPVLITSSDGLSPQTQEQIERIMPSKIIVCGGTAALPNEVVSAAAEAAGTSPQVIRCAGENADGTAVDVYTMASFATGKSFGSTAFVCTDAGYWDALSVASYAYAKGCPILLAKNGDELPSEAISAMRLGGITNVYLVGGTKAVSDSVRSQIEGAGMTVSGRLSGDDAVGTSAAVATFELSNGMQANCMAVTTAGGYWDALSGAAMCGRRESVLVLATDANRSAIDAVVGSGSPITDAFVLGGTAAVSAPTKAYLDALLAG